MAKGQDRISRQPRQYGHRFYSNMSHWGRRLAPVTSAVATKDIVTEASTIEETPIAELLVTEFAESRTIKSCTSGSLHP